MELTQLMTLPQASRFACMPQSTIRKYLGRSGIEPTIAGEGRGSTMILSLKELWAVGVGKSIRAGGESLDNACKAAATLQSLADADIVRWFADEATLLCGVVLEGKVEFVPMLTTFEAVAQNKKIQTMRENAKKRGIGFACVLIDVKPMFDQLVAAHEKAKKTRPARRKKPGRG